MDAIHEAGAKVLVQLHHCGRQTAPPYIFNLTPEAPSKVACPALNVVPDEMSNERVWQLIDQFGDAAVRAKKATVSLSLYVLQACIQQSLRHRFS